MQLYTPKCIQNFRKAKDHDIKFYCSNDIKSKIKILDHKHTKGTVKNSQDNKVLRREELLVYASQTCPNSPKPSEKFVVVTSMNKDKRVRFAAPVTSLSNIPKQTDSLKTKDSNKPLLTSTGVKPTTSASGSKPSRNTKNNMITRPLSRTFTIVENRCPLTRITSTKVVSTKKTSTKSVATPTQGILVYSRRPKATRSVGSSSKVKIIESKTSNSKEPKQSWRSTVFDVPSSFLSDCRPMRVQSINRREYILFIVDDYSQFTWVKFLRSKDEVPEFVIKFLKMIQVYLNATVQNIRTDHGTEFVNHTLKTYYEEVEISHQTSVARTSQQNGVVERRNCTLIEDLGKLKPKADIGIFLNPPPSVDLQVPTVIAPEPTISTGTPSSTTINQDAPSTSTSQTPPETPSSVIPLGCYSKSCAFNQSTMLTHQQMDQRSPNDKVIGDPSRSVSTRQQLQDEALFCYFDAFLSSVKPKSYKDALTESFTQLEAICIFIAFAVDMNMVIYQIDVKTVFLNDILRKEVYVSQPNRFVDPENPNNLYKLKKSLYGLKQAPQSIKKYGMETCKPADTPMVGKSKLDEDPHEKAVDPTRHRGMIGTLMYLTASTPDLVFVVCMCARRKRHFKWSLILSRTPHALRLSLSLQMSQKSLCSRSGIQSRRTTLDICPRVKGVNFTDVPDDDTILSFLINLGYKGLPYKHTNMFVDHMHQPWTTLEAIINKCLSRKIASNDKLRKSRIDIPWGMFYRENVDYPELIWEDLAFQIDHRKEKSSRRKNMPFPRFTKVIINHFLKKHNSLSNLKFQHYHIIKDDGIVCRLKSVRIESEPELEPVKRKTSSKRRVKKKVTLSAGDNIILDDLDTTLELEQEAVDIMQALNESKNTSKRQSGSGGSSKGTDTIPGVPDKSTVVFATSSEGTGTKPGVPDKEKDITKENVILEWGSKQESKYSEEDNLNDEEKDDKEGDADDEDDETKSNKDDIYKYKIFVRKDGDEEMLNAKVKDFDKGDEEVTDAAKADAKKTLEVKDDAMKTKLPPTSSSLFVSSGFGDQFLKLSYDSSLVCTIKDTTDAEINSLLEVKIQYEVPHIQSSSMLRVPISMISVPSALTLIQESPSIAIITTLPPPSVSITPSLTQQTTTPIPTPPIIKDAPIITTTVSESDALSVVQIRVAELKKDVFELKKIDLSAKALAAL
nr:integrase, catalytic region, zinc finger, CCHC-type, peptidase aspartic, catalytic [Tanacetum cinerariifolium]